MCDIAYPHYSATLWGGRRMEPALPPGSAAWTERPTGGVHRLSRFSGRSPHLAVLWWTRCVGRATRYEGAASGSRAVRSHSVRRPGAASVMLKCRWRDRAVDPVVRREKIKAADECLPKTSRTSSRHKQRRKRKRVESNDGDDTTGLWTPYVPLTGGGGPAQGTNAMSAGVPAQGTRGSVTRRSGGCAGAHRQSRYPASRTAHRHTGQHCANTCPLLARELYHRSAWRWTSEAAQNRQDSLC